MTFLLVNSRNGSLILKLNQNYKFIKKFYIMNIFFWKTKKKITNVYNITINAVVRGQLL